MRRLPPIAAVLLVQSARLGTAWAQGPALSVSSDPGPLVVSTAVAGLPPDPVSDGQSTYSVSVSQPGARITGRLDAPLPAGVVITLSLQAPAGASSVGPVELDVVERDLVTGIPAGAFSGLPTTYELSATTAAGMLAASTRTVTLTLRQTP